MDIARQEAPLRLQKEAIEVKQAQTTLDAQQRMLKAMQNLGQTGQAGPQTPSGAAESAASYMDALGKMSLESGLPEQAKEYSNTGPNLRKNEPTIETNQNNVLLRHAELTGRLMEGVSAQASFDRANQMYQIVPGQPSRYAGARYTPQLGDQIRNLATSIKD